MQYKIPVQIENEDPIFVGLSLKQLTIVMIGCGIGYSIWEGLAPSVGGQIAALPGILIAALAFAIAKFKIAEMTFMQFILSFIRGKVNIEERKWIKGVDSYPPIDIGYITNSTEKKEEKINFKSKIDKIKNLEDKLNKI